MYRLLAGAGERFSLHQTRLPVMEQLHTVPSRHRPFYDNHPHYHNAVSLPRLPKGW